MSETKKPYELKEGDFCYIKGEPCQVHKIRTACGEYYMAGNPVAGEKKELDHIIDCTETVEVPLVASLKVARLVEDTVTVVNEKGIEQEIPIVAGPLADNIAALVDEKKPVSVKVISANGRQIIVDVDEEYGK